MTQARTALAMVWGVAAIIAVHYIRLRRVQYYVYPLILRTVYLAARIHQLHGV